MRIQVVKPGTIPVESFEHPVALKEKGMFGSEGGSTVVLIQNDKNILVDTGFDSGEDFSETNRERNEKILLAYLDGFDAGAEDIDIVFLTHRHRDHTGNVDIFQKHGSEVVAGVDVSEGNKLGKNVTVIDTSGHTPNHKSLLVKVDNKKVVVAGDAIVSATYYMQEKVWKYAYGTNFEKAIQSMNKIVKIADYIIPGHGMPFENMKGKGISLA